MNAQTEQVATQWLTKHRFTSDPRTLALIVQRAEELVAELGGYLAVAHFERSYLELLNKGQIKRFGTFESQRAPEIPKDVIEFIEKSSAFEQQRRYKTDPVFRQQYDEYSQQSRQVPAGDIPRTAAEYHQLPARTIALRYQKEPAFKAAIDALIAKGAI